MIKISQNKGRLLLVAIVICLSANIIIISSVYAQSNIAAYRKNPLGLSVASSNMVPANVTITPNTLNTSNISTGNNEDKLEKFEKINSDSGIRAKSIATINTTVADGSAANFRPTPTIASQKASYSVVSYKKPYASAVNFDSDPINQVALANISSKEDKNTEYKNIKDVIANKEKAGNENVINKNDGSKIIPFIVDSVQYKENSQAAFIIKNMKGRNQPAVIGSIHSQNQNGLISNPYKSSSISDEKTIEAFRNSNFNSESSPDLGFNALIKNNSNISADTIVVNAKKLLGTPYKWGGNSPSEGLDCSGFVRYVFWHTLNINLPRTASEIAQQGSKVNVANLSAGDIVFFNTRGPAYSHLGIYIGGGSFIHAPSRKSHVRIDNISDNYWSNRYETAKRLF
jgi:cell wall-associated NlpC family hydrolase